MLKRVILDLDNTIIPWKDKYIKGLENTINFFNLKVAVNTIDTIINSLEYKYDRLSKQILLDEINASTSLNINMSFIDKLFEEQKKLSDIDYEVIDVLEYLSSKYELVVLTNYFKEVQLGRLKNALLDKYFKEVIGGDQVCQKPNPQSFKLALGKFKKEECIMVGDNLAIDIKGALDFKMPAILCDYNDKYPLNKDYKVIKSFKELKDIL